MDEHEIQWIEVGSSGLKLLDFCTEFLLVHQAQHTLRSLNLLLRHRSLCQHVWKESDLLGIHNGFDLLRGSKSSEPDDVGRLCYVC